MYLNKGDKTEAQGVLGWQNRSSGGCWDRKTERQASFAVDLGSIWGDSGRVLGGSGEVLGRFWAYNSSIY